MKSLKIAFLLITGALTLIGACLPWWTVIDIFLDTKTTVGFNPLFSGSEYIPTTPLSTVVGIITMIGGVLLFAGLKNRNLGILGGFIALVGVILFIPVFYIDDIGGTIVMGESLGLFDQFTIGYHNLTTYLGYGWYLALIGAIMGIFASRNIQPNAE